MKCILFVWTFFFISASMTLLAQEASIQAPTMNVYRNDLHGSFFYHQVNQGENLYRISKKYGVSSTHIMQINRMKNNHLSIGEKLRIPLNKENLMWKIPSNEASNIKLYYTVKSKENLFRISRIYFDLNSKELKRQNGIRKNRLDINQKLFIGYMPLGNKSENLMAEVMEPKDSIGVVLEENDQGSESTIIGNEKQDTQQLSLPSAKENVQIIYQTGAAYWDKNQTDRGGMYVLHKNASLNSLIEIVNPMFDEKIIAKVVGNIPPDIYPDDVMIIVSPAIAKKLKAIDARFYVKVRYLRPKSVLTNH